MEVLGAVPLSPPWEFPEWSIQKKSWESVRKVGCKAVPLPVWSQYKWDGTSVFTLGWFISQWKAWTENNFAGVISLGVIPSPHASETSPLTSWWKWDYNLPLEIGKNWDLGSSLQPQMTKHDNVSGLTVLQTQMNQTQSSEHRSNTDCEFGFPSRPWPITITNPGDVEGVHTFHVVTSPNPHDQPKRCVSPSLSFYRRGSGGSKGLSTVLQSPRSLMAKLGLIIFRLQALISF